MPGDSKDILISLAVECTDTLKISLCYGQSGILKNLWQRLFQKAFNRLRSHSMRDRYHELIIVYKSGDCTTEKLLLRFCSVISNCIAWTSASVMDYKTTGLETSDHVGCFRFADWLILWSRWPQHSGKKWRKYRKIIRNSCPTWVHTDRFHAFFICKL